MDVCVCVNGLTSLLVGGERSLFCFDGRCGRCEVSLGGGGAGARGRGIRVDCEDI